MQEEAGRTSRLRGQNSPERDKRPVRTGALLTAASLPTIGRNHFRNLESENVIDRKRKGEKHAGQQKERNREGLTYGFLGKNTHAQA